VSYNNNEKQKLLLVVSLAMPFNIGKRQTNKQTKKNQTEIISFERRKKEEKDVEEVELKKKKKK
jgi:hypothetical protein